MYAAYDLALDLGAATKSGNEYTFPFDVGKALAQATSLQIIDSSAGTSSPAAITSSTGFKVLSTGATGSVSGNVVTVSG